ncbi:MAG: hypothetical protein M3P85_16245 [Actinomycetota bacterium]|nr:hypothetical protein [Actinomycetota bacterium]
MRTALTITLASVLVLAGPAGAVHWPFFGGDAGRSGYQPVDEASGPIDFLYSRTGAEDRNIVTSIITSAGTPATQRVIYGTGDGVIQMRTLLDGAPVGPATGIDVSNQENAFGDGLIGSVTFGETSTPAGLGQVFAPHNDAEGVSIAQIDETTGALVRDVPVAAAAGYEINSSVLLTGPAPDTGNRALFFVAQNAAGVEALFRVPLTAAGTSTGTIGAATVTADINATPEASPTLAFLGNPAGAADAVAPFVAVGTLDGFVRTFNAADLVAGPSLQVAGDDDVVMTPSVPVSDSGMPPGAPGSNATRAPFLYVASTANALFDNPTTTVHRLAQAGNASSFTEVSSAALAGSASPALAVNQEVVGNVPEAVASVFVATENNLYGLSTDTLAVTARLVPGDDLEGGLDGFGRTTPAASGDLVFVATDNGEQLVLNAANLQPVPAGGFTENPGNDSSVSSIGQPSITRRFIQFASDKGLFVYRFRSAAPLPTTPPPAAQNGYWLVARDGGVFAFGSEARFFGSTGSIRLNQPMVGMAASPTNNGYWLVAADGGVFAFGDAQFFGSTGSLRLNQPVVGMAATPSGKGYWLVAADGGIFAFGDARFHGSTGGLRLNRPVVGMAATGSGNGYWLVASDGGVFAFGDAAFRGSTGAIRLNQPMVGMAALPSGTGYWLVAADGGIFAFGDAGFFGSTGALRLNRPVVGMDRTRSNNGYWLVASDGGVFAFGDARFLGSTGAIRLNQPMVGMAAPR